MKLFRRRDAADALNQDKLIAEVSIEKSFFDMHRLSTLLVASINTFHQVVLLEDCAESQLTISPIVSSKIMYT